MFKVFALIAVSAVQSVVLSPAVAQTDSDRAALAYGNGNPEQAVIELLNLAEQSPENGIVWLYLGAAQERIGDCPSALASLDTALVLGVNGARGGQSTALFRKARCYAREGRLSSALRTLEEIHFRWGALRFDEVVADEAFSELVATQAFRRLSGDLPEGWSAQQRWRHDLEYFETLMLRRHPDGPTIVASSEWRNQRDRLAEVAGTASAHEMLFGYMRLAALAGDGHTVIYPPMGGPAAVRMLPVKPYRFDDGWRIIAASPAHSELIGARVSSINGVDILTAEQQLMALTPGDNRYSQFWFAEAGLQIFELNTAIGSANNSESVVWGLELLSGEHRQVTLQANEPDRDPTRLLPPQPWVFLNVAELPSFLSRADEPFWMEWLGTGVLYVQLNTVSDLEAMSFSDIGTDITSSASDASVLILDLRYNRGGNGFLIEGFMRELSALSLVHESGRFFILTGRRTFSAAGELVGTLRQETAAIIAGEPTGSRPSTPGTDTPFQLPHSGFSGSISSHTFINGRSSDDNRPYFVPDIYVAETWDGWVSGEDQVIQEIVERYAGD